MKTKLSVVLGLIGIFAIIVFIEILDFAIRQLTFTFMSQNWVALLSFVFSSVSLVLAAISYRHQTRASLRIDTTSIWDLDLERETLENGDTTATVTTRAGSNIDTFTENSGGCATTLKALQIVKRSGILRRKSLKAEFSWRKDFIMTQMDREGKLIQLSFWDKVEPGQRLKLLMPYIEFLDTMVVNRMLDLESDSQGQFQLIIRHIYGEAKSSVFWINLSEPLRSFISERVKAFGRIIVRNS